MCLKFNNEQVYKMDFTTTSETTSNKKTSYSIKKMLKHFFKLHKSQKLIISNKVGIIETTSSKYLDSNHNEIEPEQKYPCMDAYTGDHEEPAYAYQSSKMEDFDEEPAAAYQSCEMEDFDISDFPSSVPVHFVRTEHGTFFWTSSSDIPADNDLVQPMSCSTYNQLACLQARWTEV